MYDMLIIGIIVVIAGWFILKSITKIIKLGAIVAVFLVLYYVAINAGFIGGAMTKGVLNWFFSQLGMN